MLDTEYSSSEANTIPADALISGHAIGCVGETCIVVLVISSTLVKPNPSYDLKCECIYFMIFKTTEHVKS